MIVTFYSHSAHTGRTTALANIAILLARSGRRVLLVDFDLQSPSLPRVFRDYAPVLFSRTGVIDLLRDVAGNGDDEQPDWRDHVVKIRVPDASLSLITSGAQHDDYRPKVLGFDRDAFFADSGRAEFFEQMRQVWRDEYDVVLVDSSSGITDAGAVATVGLADLIVGVFTTDQRSVDGLVDVLHRVQAGRQNLPFDRSPAAVLPLPSRIDPRTGPESTTAWLDLTAERFREFSDDWLPADVPARQLVARTWLPEVTAADSGGRLAALAYDMPDPTSLGYVLVTVTALTQARLANAKRIVERRAVPAAAAVGRRGALTETAERDAREAWNLWRSWSGRATRLERSVSRFRSAGQLLLIAAAALAVLAAADGLPGLVARACAVGSVVCLILLPVIRARSSGRGLPVSGRRRAVCRFRRHARPAGRGPADREHPGRPRVRPLCRPHEPAAADVTKAMTYFTGRVDPTLSIQKWHLERMRKRSSALRAGELVLVFAGVVLGVWAAVSGAYGLTGWIAVATTAIGATAAHVAAGRYDSRLVTMQRTMRNSPTCAPRWR